MGLIHLPFLKGQDQTADPKIAPLGVLRSAKNVRFDREGRIVKRSGFDVHSVLSQFSSSDIGGGTFAFLSAGIKAIFARGVEKVAIAGNRVCSYSPTLGRWRDWNPVTVWSAPERLEVGRDVLGRALRPSVAYANGYICVCFEVLNGSQAFVHAAIYDAGTLTLVAFDKFTGSVNRRPRVVAIGVKFVLVYVDASGAPSRLMCTNFDTTSVTSGWTAPGQIITGTALTSDYFDLTAYDASNAYVVHVVAANFLAARIDTVGTVSVTALFAATGIPTVYGDTAIARVMVGWLTAAGALTVRSYTAALGGAVGSTILDTQATHQGQVTIGNDNNDFRVSCSQDDPVTALDQRVRTWRVTPATNANTEDFSTNGHRLASKMLSLQTRCWYWTVNRSSFDRTYFLRSSAEDAPFTIVARGQAVDFSDSDNYVSEFISYTSSGRTFALWAAPTVAGSDASSAAPLTGVDLVRVELGGTERHQAMVLGDNLYITGGLLTMFDGALAHEAGFLHEPRFISGTPAGGGALQSSKTYQYLLTHHWFDANGQLHLSGVSDPLIVPLGAGDSSVTLKWQHPRQSWRFAKQNNTANKPDFRVRQHLWRTEGDGTIFHQLTDELGYSVSVSGATFGTVGTLADVAADSTIAAKGVVYTQGARGGLSGPLQHDPPPPCRYLWAGKERAIIGGLERPNEVRWSKFFFPGEALEFSEDSSFRKLVAGSVRATAMLDDVSLVFTDTQIFVVTGTGPDDTGAGTFDEPKALPSDVGIITWKSLVEWSGGLFFQGNAEMLYLIPRGIGSPQPQFATQEPLRLYPTVTSARLVPEQNLVVFTLTGGAGSKGGLLCFDTQNGQWTFDEVAGGIEHAASAVIGGRLLLVTADGLSLDVESATSHVDRANQFVSVSLETAWLRPHGLQADGRTRKVGVLGEYRADCSLKMELSVNDSRSYAYSKTWNLGAVDVAGDPLRREWDLPVQKFGSASLRITELQNGSNANEGFVLHGLTLDTRPRPGMPRLKQGFR